MRYWILKSDPDTYSIDDLIRDKETDWDGVRNYQARNNIKQMEPGDLAFIYHSQSERTIVAIAEITSTPFIDKTAKEDTWYAVRIQFKEKLSQPISLQQIKTNDKLKDIALVRQSRLSVIPISEENYNDIMEMNS